MKALNKRIILRLLAGVTLSMGLFAAGCGGNSSENPVIQTEPTELVVEEFTDLTIASIGDSITTGFNSVDMNSIFIPLVDNPEENWSTGNARSSLNSHYQRLVGLFSTTGIRVNRINKATQNERVISNSYNGLMGQATQLEALLDEKHFNYVTILMGGNDICATSSTTNQFKTNFRNEVQTAVEKLLPKADLILLSSIPNVRAVLEGPSCPFTSVQFDLIKTNFCRNHILPDNVLDSYLAAANEALEEVASLYPKNVKYDGGAVYNTPVTGDMISDIDCFHPSLKGQQNLSSELWSIIEGEFDPYVPQQLTN